MVIYLKLILVIEFIYSRQTDLTQELNVLQIITVLVNVIILNFNHNNFVMMFQYKIGIQTSIMLMGYLLSFTPNYKDVLKAMLH